MYLRIAIRIGFLFSLTVLCGCAGMSHGIKVYPQKVYLFVDAEKPASKLITLPDIKNGYEIKPWSFLSKHEFEIKIAESQVSEVSSKQDSTAALALLQKIVEVAGQLGMEALKEAAQAAKAGAKAVAKEDYDSAFGLATGIYELNELGRFQKVSP